MDSAGHVGKEDIEGDLKGDREAFEHVGPGLHATALNAGHVDGVDAGGPGDFRLGQIPPRSLRCDVSAEFHTQFLRNHRVHPCRVTNSSAVSTHALECTQPMGSESPAKRRHSHARMEERGGFGVLGGGQKGAGSGGSTVGTGAAQGGGKAADQWTRQQLQLPKGLANDFRDMSAERGARIGGVKMYGTAALAVLMGMPEEARKAAVLYCVTIGWDHPSEISPEGAWAAVREAMQKEAPAESQPPHAQEATLVHPPEQKEGYVEQRIERVRVRPEPPTGDEPKRKTRGA